MKTYPRNGQIEIQYLFVIDTDIYAGNFEREMCAYVTGQIGECEVGEELAGRAVEENAALVQQLEDIIDDDFDDDGTCRRPVTLYPTPNIGKPRENNSVAILFHRLPTDDQIQKMIRRARAIASKGLGRIKCYPKISGFRLVTVSTKTTKTESQYGRE